MLPLPVGELFAEGDFFEFAHGGAGDGVEEDEGVGELPLGGWPRLNSEKRLWVAYPFGFGLWKGGGLSLFHFLISIFQFLFSNKPQA